MNLNSRQEALRKFNNETFDLLIVGGGITGAAVARDAVTRGLKVALIERSDFAEGTSSRSSKLIHGGLRYLENFEFGLVFEALAERALLLKTCPHLVKPLPFFMPVYKGDPHSKNKISAGLWLYDLLALFRTPGFHKRLSQSQLLNFIPQLNSEGLTGGFRYYDASMLDDVMVTEILRSAQAGGAALANYCEATEPFLQKGLVSGFRWVNRDPYQRSGDREGVVCAKRVISCTGPWTDMTGNKVSPAWRNWLRTSKGVHILFPFEKLPLPGAMVMSHPSDGRIVFVMPRKDLGSGVTIVGTTDGKTDPDPSKVKVEADDIHYLLALLKRYFPEQKLGASDIISAYAGVRPLVQDAGTAGSEGQASLQKISREHHIDEGAGGVIWVAGGKYTTHRTMAEEIVDFALKSWREAALRGEVEAVPPHVGKSATRVPVNPQVLPEVVRESRAEAEQRGLQIDPALFDRYGAEALGIADLHLAHMAGVNRDVTGSGDDEGFPLLEAQLRFALRESMVVRLSDFYMRRTPLVLAREDHGVPFAERLAAVWAEERGLTPQDADREQRELEEQIYSQSRWKEELRFALNAT